MTLSLAEPGYGGTAQMEIDSELESVGFPGCCVFNALGEAKIIFLPPMVSRTVTATFTATLFGSSASATLTILPARVEITIDNSTIVGGTGERATARVRMVPPLIVTVPFSRTVTPSEPRLVSLSAGSHVPPGGEGMFTIQGALVSEEREIEITVTVHTVTGPISDSSSVTLTPPSLDFSLSPSSLITGTGDRATGKITVSPAFSASLFVQKIDPPRLGVTKQPRVNHETGLGEAEFLPNSFVEKATPVSVTIGMGTATGLILATDSLTLLPKSCAQNPDTPDCIPPSPPDPPCPSGSGFTALGDSCPVPPPDPPKQFAVVAKTVPGKHEQMQIIPLEGELLSPPFDFKLGEIFKVEVYELDKNGNKARLVLLDSKNPISLIEPQFNTAPIATEFFNQSKRLFPNNVLVNFTGQDYRQQFLAVHSGKIKIKIKFSIIDEKGNSQIREVNSPVTIPICQPTNQKPGAEPIDACGFTLGDQPNNFDPLIIRFADVTGIPPQIIKAHIFEEAGRFCLIDGTPTNVLTKTCPKDADIFFNADSYRYEPLSVDFKYVSTDVFKNRRDKDGRQLILEWLLRTKKNYESYRVKTFKDSDSVALEPGNGFAQLESEDRLKLLGLRENFFVIANNRNIPFKDLYAPKVIDPTNKIRKITISDGPISMENILFISDPIQHHNWASKGKFWYNEYMRIRLTQPKPLLTPFTAQTVLSASYGLSQILYDSAVSRFQFRDKNNIGLPPHRLFEPSTSIDLSTNFMVRWLSKLSNGCFTKGECLNPDTLYTAYRIALDTSSYNGDPGYPPKVEKRIPTMFPVRVSTNGSRP